MPSSVIVERQRWQGSRRTGMGCGLRRDSDSRPSTRAAFDTPCATRPAGGAFDVASYRLVTQLCRFQSMSRRHLS